MTIAPGAAQGPFWLVGVLVLACNVHTPQGQATKATHANGLSFQYDERVRQVVPLPDGYTLQLAPANARAINEITVRVQEAPVAGSDAWPEKTLGARTFRFSEERFDGGSGGDECRLVIVALMASRWLVLEQQVQSEAAPNYDVAWQVLKTAALR